MDCIPLPRKSVDIRLPSPRRFDTVGWWLRDGRQLVFILFWLTVCYDSILATSTQGCDAVWRCAPCCGTFCPDLRLGTPLSSNDAAGNLAAVVDRAWKLSPAEMEHNGTRGDFGAWCTCACRTALENRWKPCPLWLTASVLTKKCGTFDTL